MTEPERDDVIAGINVPEDVENALTEYGVLCRAEASRRSRGKVLDEIRAAVRRAIYDAERPILARLAAAEGALRCVVEALDGAISIRCAEAECGGECVREALAMCRAALAATPPDEARGEYCAMCDTTHPVPGVTPTPASPAPTPECVATAGPHRLVTVDGKTYCGACGKFPTAATPDDARDSWWLVETTDSPPLYVSTRKQTPSGYALTPDPWFARRFEGKQDAEEFAGDQSRALGCVLRVASHGFPQPATPPDAPATATTLYPVEPAPPDAPKFINIKGAAPASAALPPAPSLKSSEAAYLLRPSMRPTTDACSECGKPESDSHHVRYGPDEDNPVKHHYVPPTTPKPPRPEIVCLCGSTRFIETFHAQYGRLTDEGKIVLTVGRVVPQSEQALGSPRKAALDTLHLRKIDLADRVLVLNVGGYVGPSTRREIAYARETGKPVDLLYPDAGLNGPPPAAPPAQEPRA